MGHQNDRPDLGGTVRIMHAANTTASLPMGGLPKVTGRALEQLNGHQFRHRHMIRGPEDPLHVVAAK